MENSGNGNAPATKADLRALKLDMLAGFQLCMEELQAIMGVLAAMRPSVSKETLEELIIAQRAHFDQQMEIARQQLLGRQNQEECD